MGQINLSNSNKRDAMVNTSSVTVPLKVRYIDDQGRQAQRASILKGTIDRSAEALAEKFDGLDNVGQALIDGDPEVDLETFGGFLINTSRVYVGIDRQAVHRVTQFDVVIAPDGEERERRPHEVAEGNTATETPLRWSGKLMPKKKVYNRFVFASKMQITHVNGLTYDFLFEMAKTLEEKDSVMLLGAGRKGAEPLVFQRGGTSYRGFLEGRTDGEKYCLLLHLSNMEMKLPEGVEA